MSKDNENIAARKVNIKPITFVIEITAEKVSDKGTFSGIKITSIKSSIKDLQGHLKVAVPPRGGGAMYLRTDTLDGIKVTSEETEAAKPQVKLF